MLAVFSGVRQGELLGLKWSDVDWKNCQISIVRTFNNQAMYPPKTETSRRKIDLGSVFCKRNGRNDTWEMIFCAYFVPIKQNNGAKQRIGK